MLCDGNSYAISKNALGIIATRASSGNPWDNKRRQGLAMGIHGTIKDGKG